MKHIQQTVFLLLFAFAACQPNKSSQLEESKTNEPLNSTLDTIIFKTSSDQKVYIGTRILPEANITDSAATNFLANSEIASVMEVGDTIFIFLNNNMLVSEANKYFPQINDSLLQYHYPNIYDVEVDDDLPYFAYLRSDKDYVEFTKDKKFGEFTWTGAVVTDTVLNFMNGIKIGASKASVFGRFNLNAVDKSNLTIILCHASMPSRIWFKSYLPELRNYEYPTTPILLRIDNNVLTGILIDFWICHGKASEQLLTKLNQN
ncbi:MAG: hypothetical protein RIC06_05150 [Cyclobacteriaceae bacterium]